MSDLVVETNSYISVDDADTYFGDRLEATDWSDATDDNKAIALIQATRMLDQQFEWQGDITDVDQALDFPRTSLIDDEGRLLDSDVIPAQIENAACELAIFILGGNTAEPLSLLSKGFKRAKVGPLEVETDLAFTPIVVPDKVIAAVGGLGRLKTSSIGTFR